MNKIITIHLGGISFDIEEDAYEALRAYLLSVRDHFRNSENGKEILEDIESRIAEMLFQNLKGKKSSVNATDVQEVIRVMGNPSQFETTEEPDTDQTVPNPGPRRLFRDPDSKVLGGVCSGLSKYLGMDVTIIRVIWLVLVFAFGTGALFYLILWVVVPKAVTAADKLQMSGEIPNIENIRNSVREEAGKAYSQIKEKARGPEAREIRNQLEELLLRFARVVSKFFSLVLSIALLVLLLLFSIHFFTGSGFFQWFWVSDLTEQINDVMGNSGLLLLTKLSLYGMFAIPVLSLLIHLTAYLLDLPRPAALVRKSLWAIWLICFTSAVSIVAYSTLQFRSEGEMRSTEPVQFIGDTVSIRSDRFYPVCSERDFKVYLDIEPTEAEGYLQIRRLSRGKSTSHAEENASRIKTVHAMNGRSFILYDTLYPQRHDIGWKPELHYTLYIPVGKVVYLDPSCETFLRYVTNTQGWYAGHLAGKYSRMTADGLQCNNCSDDVEEAQSSSYRIMPLEGFQQLKLSDVLMVRLVADGKQFLEIPTEPWTQHLQVDEEDHMLELSLKKELEMIIKGKSVGEHSPLILHTSALNSIVSNGASEIEAEMFNRVRDLDVLLNGASRFVAKGVALENLKVEANGAAYVEIAGSAALFKLEATGASKIRAVELQCEYLKAELNGAADCEAFVTREIDGKINGAGKIRYRGDAVVKQGGLGISQIEKW